MRQLIGKILSGICLPVILVGCGTTKSPTSYPPPPTLPGTFSQVHFVSDQRDYLATNVLGAHGDLYETSDAGARWHLIWTTPAGVTPLTSMQWFGATGLLVAAVGKGPQMGNAVSWISLNGGNSWKQVRFPTAINPSTVSASTAHIVVGEAMTGTWFISVDGGHHWTAMATVPPASATQVLFVKGTTGYWLASQGVWQTHNEGQQWSRISAISRAWIPTAMSGAVPNHLGIATTAAGNTSSYNALWVHTTKGWRQIRVAVPLPTPAIHGFGNNGLSVASSQNAAATVGILLDSGGSPVIVHTTNGGTTWRNVNVPPVPFSINPHWRHPLVTAIDVIHRQAMTILLGQPSFSHAGAAVLEYTNNGGRTWKPVAIAEESLRH